MSLTDRQFEQIRSLAAERYGLHIKDEKRDLVNARLTRHVTRHRYGSVDDFLHHLMEHGTDEEMLELFDILSTNFTSFFRESAQFDYLEREFYTPLARGNVTRPGRRLRLWSAGCSSGCEPYSMAIQAHELLPDLDTWDYRILATDLSTTALQTAANAVFPDTTIQTVDAELVKRHFLRGTGASAGQVKVAKHIRDLITIQRLNLHDPWPMKGPFDVIFCRNVMIYFDTPTRHRLIRRFHRLLRPDGILAIGSAETLAGCDVPFEPVQPSTYRRMEGVPS